MTKQDDKRPVVDDRQPEAVDADAVGRYLAAHPDFFQQRSELLASLHIPHERGDSISLVSHQLRILREQLQKSKARLRDLVDVARLNEELQERMHVLTLSLAAAGGIEDFFDRLHGFLHEQLQVDCAALRLFIAPPAPHLADRPEFAGEGSASQALLGEWLEGRWAWAGMARKTQCRYLFPEQEGIASLVLLLLSGGALVERGRAVAATTGHDGAWRGILAIGSMDATRFRASLGLELLSRQAQLISALLQPLLAASRVGFHGL